MNGTDFNAEIKALIDRWCDRRDYGPLANVLPAWRAWAVSGGLTDGWETLYDALRHAYAAHRDLPVEEREMLKTLYVEIDVALRNR